GRRSADRVRVDGGQQESLDRTEASEVRCRDPRVSVLTASLRSTVRGLAKTRPYCGSPTSDGSLGRSRQSSSRSDQWVDRSRPSALATSSRSKQRRRRTARSGTSPAIAPDEVRYRIDGPR